MGLKHTKEEYYLELVAFIHLKEEKELQAHPTRIRRRLEVLTQFSNEVLGVAQVLSDTYEQG